VDSFILGLNFGTHDAAAALVIDGAVAAAAEEERFTRVKQTKAFPTQAITYCLREVGVDPGDIEQVALFVDPRLQLLLPMANLAHGFPASLGSLLSDLDKYRHRRRAPARIRDSGLFPPTSRVVSVRHHLAHAASAYLTSPFEDATVVTIDGRGEYETACVFHGLGGRLRRRHAVVYPHSIGYFYSMMTRYLGFHPQRDEYKVMGLAGYGGPTYLDAVADLATFDPWTGRLRLNLRYFDHHCRPSPDRQLYSDNMLRRFGPARGPDEPITDRHKDLAFAVQRHTEDLVLRYVSYARKVAPSRNLCLAGGVALNGVANAALIESGLFNAVYVQPAANDAGTSLGAALAATSATKPKMERHTFDNAFLGPAFTPADIATAAQAAQQVGCTVQSVLGPAAAGARLLADNMIIGWFQGRMEFGPRALGARSILAHPGHAANTTRINALIKRRERFRPLAPAILAEHASDYFHLHEAGRAVYPFMLATAPVQHARRSAIPAVVHVDATARVQTVSRTNNPHLWQLIHDFHTLTGLPVVLNTSFNGAHEPIVCTPADAIRTFLTCGLDALVIGNLVITRMAGRA
jgi:carbamoyltransferase